MTRGHGNKDTERAPVGNVLYNRPFHQVVTSELDEESSICIWDSTTGTINTRFAGVHLDSAVTAMTFDAGGRRLVTGSHNGSELHVQLRKQVAACKTY